MKSKIFAIWMCAILVFSSAFVLLGNETALAGDEIGPVDEIFDAVESDITLQMNGGMLEIIENGTVYQYDPFAVISLTINGNNLDNTLTVDFTNGIPIPLGGLIYDGKNAGGDFDTMELTGGSVDAFSHTTVTEYSGSFDITDAGTTYPITYANLEPVISTITASDVDLVFTGGAEYINTSQNAASSSDTTDIFSTDGESISFITPTVTLSIDTSEVAVDTISLASAAINFDACPNFGIWTSSNDIIEVDARPFNVASLQLGGDPTLRFNIDGAASGDFDQLSSNAAIIITDVKLDLVFGYAPASGDQYIIIETSAGVMGTFAGLAEGSYLTHGDGFVYISYVGGDGNDIELTYIEYDFGDTPDPTYPTLLASNGARHTLGGSLYLGASVDTDADGQPTAAADGDDLDAGGDDEDGVTFTTALEQGKAASVDVSSSGAGLLNAWIDFNQDGDWGDAGEQIFTDEALAAGVNNLGFNIPAGAVIGNTFARFRLDSAGGLNPTGLAADGEVEDYQVTITLALFSGGDGSAGDPYQITNVFELQNMSLRLGANFTIMNDIDASITSTWDGNAGFTPVGSTATPFTGTIDGQGYVISDLFIDRPTTDEVALFGYTGPGSLIADIELEMIDITGQDGVGSFIGYCYGEVTLCFMKSGSVVGRDAVGGLIGYVNPAGAVNFSYSNGIVGGTNKVGGLIGHLASTCNYSSSEAFVIGQMQVGGLVGIAGEIGDCYATGNVTAIINAGGGLAGEIWAAIVNSYSTGTVTGGGTNGGLAGTNPIVWGSATNCYWDTETSGMPGSTVGTGRTTAQMMQQATFDPLWDFTSTWRIDETITYPYFQWEDVRFYLIYDIFDLQNMSNDLSGDYIIMNDIDATATVGWNTEAGFDPVGDDITRFNGSLEGQGYTITGLTINRSTENYVGLFGYTHDWAEIKNVVLEDVNISGQDNTGALAGWNRGTINDCQIKGNVSGNVYTGGVLGRNYGTISDCFKNGKVTGSSRVGGFVGYNGATIQRCNTTTDTVTGSSYIGGFAGQNGNTLSYCSATTNYVNGTSERVGGLVGYNTVRVEFCYAKANTNGNSRYVSGLVGYNFNAAVIDYCAAEGTVFGVGDYVGGLAGCNYYNILKSYSTCDVTGQDQYTGGLVGYLWGDIRDSYNTGNVSGNNDVGGLTGFNHNDGFGMDDTIDNCYSTGVITGNSNVGAIVGVQDGSDSTTLYDCFWDNQTSGTDIGYGAGFNANGVGKNTTEMKKQATFTGWNFATIWDIKETFTYPFFIWNQFNSAPIAQDDNVTTDEDISYNGNVTVDNGQGPDVDPDSDPITVIELNGNGAVIGVPTALGSGAIVTLNANGTFTYNPNGQFEALSTVDWQIDTFDYTIFDDNGTYDNATVYVNVTGVNDAPVLNSIGNQAINELNLLAFTATATDPEVDGLTFTLEGTPPTGAGITTGGDFTWTPTEAQGPGFYNITIRVTDDGAPNLFDNETIMITVGEVNLAPVLTAIGNQAVNELNLLAFTATATDTDTPVNGLLFTLDVGAPTGAVITAGGDFTWTPTETQGFGFYNITINVTDDGTPAMYDTETIMITVSEINVAPVLAAIGDKIIDELVLLDFTATANDADLPANGLTFTLDTGAPTGAAITAGGDFTWTPTEAQGFGFYNITVNVTDDGTPNMYDTETIMITVGEVNVAPALTAVGNRVVDEETTLAFTVTANDADLPANSLTFTLDAGAPAGAAITAGGAFTWTPTEAQGPGVYQVTFNVTDGEFNDTETIDITVNEVNVAPAASNDAITILEDAVATTIDVLANDVDHDNNTITIIAVTDGAHGTVTITNGGADLTYEPDADFFGTDTFTYIINDGELNDTATVTITVENTNDEPIALDDAASVDEDSSTTISVLINDDFAPDEGETLTITSVTQGTHGTVTIASGDIRIIYQPDADYVGTDTFTYTISDGNGGTATATVTMTVNNVNDNPTITTTGIINATDGDVYTIDFDATDIDGDTVTWSVTGAAWLTINSAGVLNGSAETGIYTIRVTASDGNGGSDTHTYTLTVEELDSDGDGVPDDSDKFPNDANETGDSDADGIGNNADPDDDNDGEPDATDDFPFDDAETTDTDGDGIGNNADTDDDGDGVSDVDDPEPEDSSITGNEYDTGWPYWYVLSIIGIAALIGMICLGVVWLLRKYV